MHRTNRVNHPLHYLLLMRLFGYSAEAFFNLLISEKHEPFGEGPWPCLNPTCIYFREPQIREAHIIYGQGRGGKPVGIFSCACGFEYCRTGPDLTPDDQLRIGQVRSYGHLWETTLQKLWNDPTVSLKQMTFRLGSSRNTLNRQAKRLGLPFPRGNFIHSRLAHNSPDETTQASKSIKLTEYRAAWLAVLKENPGAGQPELKNKVRNLHKWLLRNDRNWLKAHFPKRVPTSKKGRRLGPPTDWKSLDTQISETVKTSALRLRNAPGDPVRITIMAIGRDSGHLFLLRSRLNKLPLTAEVLADAVETREEFAIRRIQWATELYRLECTAPTRWQLVKRAGVYKISGRPQVKDAIDAALESLHQSNNVAQRVTLE
jgi:hypothetical protein